MLFQKYRACPNWITAIIYVLNTRFLLDVKKTSCVLALLLKLKAPPEKWRIIEICRVDDESELERERERILRLGIFEEEVRQIDIKAKLKRAQRLIEAKQAHLRAKQVEQDLKSFKIDQQDESSGNPEEVTEAHTSGKLYHYLWETFVIHSLIYWGKKNKILWNYFDFRNSVETSWRGWGCFEKDARHLVEKLVLN